jgi:glycosyltransferase involved in cell wall biosynthesis
VITRHLADENVHDRYGPGSAKTIGIVIRTLNESELIGRCLETLRRQHGTFDLDILVVDSGSTDSTVEIARSYDARIVALRPGEFDYSKALNAGIERVRGDVVVSLSAHAIPIGKDWLQKMTAPFEDPRVAGVASRQVPWPDAPWQEVHRLRHQFGESACVYSHGSTHEIVFSNAASSIRRRVWRDQPFRLAAAEDHEWARRIVAAGWTIVYEPAAAVFHSHHENARAQALRLIDINRVPDQDKGRRTRRRTLREAAGMLMRDSRKIAALDEPILRKLASLTELVRMVCYYVLDFSRLGTTAERRREDTFLGARRGPSAQSFYPESGEGASRSQRRPGRGVDRRTHHPPSRREDLRR